MRPSDAFLLLLLAAIWGASFMFLRITAPVLGPVWLVEIRLLLAGLALLPFVMSLGLWEEFRHNVKPLFVLGCLNSALPFLLFSYASLYLPAGFISILNATTPIFGAVIAFVVLSESLTANRVVGVVMGFIGVVILVGWNANTAVINYTTAVSAGLLGALMYAIAVSYVRRRLPGISPLVAASASLLSAALIVLPLTLFTIPETVPGTSVILAVIALALVSTALAYILYYRLLRSIGALKALTVTYLIPLFAMLWGAVFLGEAVTIHMVLGCGFILLGTAIANDLLQQRRAQ